MCKRHSLAFALLALGVSACTVMAAGPPPAPGGIVVREVSAVNMPIVCLDDAAAGKPLNSCAYTRQRFSSATQSSLVRSCERDPSGAEKCVSGGAVTWKRFADVRTQPYEGANPELVEVCGVEKEEGAPVSGGGCPKAGQSPTSWGAMLFVYKDKVAHVPPLPPATFTISPTSGESPLDVTLTWNVPGMTGTYPCTASGDWSGSKAAASTEVIGSVMRNSSYTLTCTDIPPGGAVLQWSAATTNTDGSPLASPEGYLLSYGNTLQEARPVLQNSVTLPNGQLTYTFLDLLPMRWFFGVQTIGNGGVKSDLSNIVSMEVQPREAQIQRYTATVTVTVVQKPAPPGELRVSPLPTTSAPARKKGGQ